MSILYPIISLSRSCNLVSFFIESAPNTSRRVVEGGETTIKYFENYTFVSYVSQVHL